MYQVLGANDFQGALQAVHKADDGDAQRDPPARAVLDCCYRAPAKRVETHTCCGEVEIFDCPKLGREVWDTKCRACAEYALFDPEAALPRLVLCINTFNEGADVRETINSFRAAYSGPFAAIVVADGTTDGSCDDLGDDVTVIRNAERVGCGRAKDMIAQRILPDDVVLHADGHCRVLEGTLDEIARIAAAHEVVIAPGVAPLHCQPNEQPAPDHGRKNTTWGGWIGATPRGAKVLPAGKPSEPYELRTSTWWAIFMFSGRTLLERLGGWNSLPGRWGSQEIGLALRTWFAAVPVITARDVVCGHRYRNWNKSGNYAYYKIRTSETKANHRYVHGIVFDPETVAELWDPAWSELCPTEHGKVMVAASKFEEQRDHFQVNCKRRTDAEFFEAFYPDGPPVKPIPLADITAVILNYKRPKLIERCVTRLRKLGVPNRWVWCQEGAAPPKDATRVFTDSENSMTWARWSLIPLVETPWVLFVDDDVELTGDGLNSLRAYAVRYPGGNLGLMGGRFKPPFTNYREVEYIKARRVEQAEPVDMLWPKGQLISRDLAQRVYGEAHLWQRMREVVKGTSGDDLISGIAQGMLGLDPPVVVPTCEAPYRESSENSKYSLARQPGRYKAKRKSLPIWRSMGWLPLEMPGSVECLTRLSTAERHGITVKQHPQELSEALDIVAEHPPRVFLEVGAYQGGSAYVYAGACEPGATIVLVDKPRGEKHKALLEVAVELLRDEGFEVLTVFGDSHSPDTIATVKGLLAGRNVDLLHIDGDHSRKGVLADWQNYAPLVQSGQALLHDVRPPDARGSGGVWRAWPEITKDRDAKRIYHGGWLPHTGGGIGLVLMHDVKAADNPGARGVAKAWAEIKGGRKAAEIFHGRWGKLHESGIGIVII